MAFELFSRCYSFNIVSNIVPHVGKVMFEQSRSEFIVRGRSR